VLTGETGKPQVTSAADPAELAHHPRGYGLPCAKCRLYYPANLEICPNCHSKERLGPQLPQVRPTPQAVAAPLPNPETLEQEREEFLRQFKSQLFAAQSPLMPSPATVCNLAEHRSGNPAPAEVCKPCYDRLQERLDVCEAALHMDLKEAAQIVYDAVWADSSDPGKTYQNAARALLTELRKRSGVSTLLGPFQPLPH
jgi:hypothetical protein